MKLPERKVLALIPAYNEAGRVAEVVAAAARAVSRVVVIDDGSADATGEVARQAGAEILRHAHNRGKGAAIATALEYLRRSDAEYGVLLDADGQHDPAEIGKLVAAADEFRADVVVGNRMRATHDMPRVRRATNRFTSWVTSKLAGQDIPDSQCGFRLLRRTVVDSLKLTTGRFETETEMLIQAGRAGHRIVTVPIRTIYEGQASHIHPVRDTLRFFRLVLRYL